MNKFLKKLIIILKLKNNLRTYSKNNLQAKWALSEILKKLQHHHKQRLMLEGLRGPKNK